MHNYSRVKRGELQEALLYERLLEFYVKYYFFSKETFTGSNIGALPMEA
jgi:hypothetical protein